MQTSRCHWHWFQTNWTYYFSPCYFNGIKIATAFKCIFEETMQKLSVNFGNHISQDSHNQYHGPVRNYGLMHHNTVTNVDQICHYCAVSFSMVTHTEVTGSPAQSSDSSLIGLFGTSYHVLALKHNNMTSSLYQRIDEWSLEQDKQQY